MITNRAYFILFRNIKIFLYYRYPVDAASKREEALIQERDNLKDEINLLRKKLFGPSSEKHVVDVPGQLNLFNKAKLEQEPSVAEAEELAAVLPAESPKKKKARAKFCNSLPYRRQEIDWKQYRAAITRTTMAN